ncbi:hypothetical protein M2283_006218 [Streptomyces pseudovenezuelae]|uniref:Chalcone/stilbene synthase C-terminal domain-containing protein n=1 Tax=Streptomyces pseudovenezuelae TaxID=67350 RepID=A0ABT6LSY1_9ACTN|nr:hypothetical protein [Streptomyces pseudovenezuelae]
MSNEGLNALRPGQRPIPGGPPSCCAEQVVDRLLSAEGLRRSNIAHCLVHSGGKKVIYAVRLNLGLTRHDLRHTSGVRRDYGNLSGGSFLFSFERLMRERVVRAGEFGVLMSMGPGSNIEASLVSGEENPVNDHLRLRIDGSRPLSAETVAAVGSVCDAAEDGGARARSSSN